MRNLVLSFVDTLLAVGRLLFLVSSTESRPQAAVPAPDRPPGRRYITTSAPPDQNSYHGHHKPLPNKPKMRQPAVRRCHGFALCDLAHRFAPSRALLRTLPCIASDALPGNASPAVMLATLPGIAPAVLALDTLPGDVPQARLHGVTLKRKSWIVGILVILHQ